MSKTTDMNIQEAIDRMVRDVVRVQCSRVLLSPEMHRGCLDRISDRVKAFCDIGPAPTDNVFVRGVPAEKCEALSGMDYALVPKSPETVTINGVPLEFIPPFKETNVEKERPMVVLIREFRKLTEAWDRYDKDPIRSPKPLGIKEFAEVCERKFVNGVPLEFIPPWDKKQDILYQAVRSTWLELNTWLTMGNNTATKKDIEELHDRMVKAMQQATESDSPRVWSDDQPVVPDEQMQFHHFDTRKLLDALGIGSCLAVTTVEYVAGQMLSPEVRKRVLEARVFEP